MYMVGRWCLVDQTNIHFCCHVGMNAVHFTIRNGFLFCISNKTNIHCCWAGLAAGRMLSQHYIPISSDQLWILWRVWKYISCSRPLLDSANSFSLPLDCYRLQYCKYRQITDRLHEHRSIDCIIFTPYIYDSRKKDIIFSHVLPVLGIATPT